MLPQAGSSALGSARSSWLRQRCRGPGAPRTNEPASRRERASCGASALRGSRPPREALREAPGPLLRSRSGGGGVRAPRSCPRTARCGGPMRREPRRGAWPGGLADPRESDLLRPTEARASDERPPGRFGPRGSGSLDGVKPDGLSLRPGSDHARSAQPRAATGARLAGRAGRADDKSDMWGACAHPDACAASAAAGPPEGAAAHDGLQRLSRLGGRGREAWRVGCEKPRPDRFAGMVRWIASAWLREKPRRAAGPPASEQAAPIAAAESGSGAAPEGPRTPRDEPAKPSSRRGAAPLRLRARGRGASVGEGCRSHRVVAPLAEASAGSPQLSAFGLQAARSAPPKQR